MSREKIAAENVYETKGKYNKLCINELALQPKEIWDSNLQEMETIKQYL